MAAELIRKFRRTIAEAWCQRGIAFFHLGQHDAAIHDCNQALQINPYHFTAAAGMGQCYTLHAVCCMTTSSPRWAFRRALRLNPGLEKVRAQVARLQRSLKRD